MTLIDYRKAVMEAIRKDMTIFSEVGPCPARFTEDDFGKFVMRHPSCRVAILGVPTMPLNNTGMFNAVAALGFFVSEKDRAKHPASDAVMELSLELAAYLSMRTFNLPGVEPMQVRNIENLHVSSFRGKSLAAVGTLQNIQLGRNLYKEDEEAAWPGELDDLGWGTDVTVNEPAVTLYTPDLPFNGPEIKRPEDE